MVVDVLSEIYFPPDRWVTEAVPPNSTYRGTTGFVYRDMYGNRNALSRYLVCENDYGRNIF